MLDSHGTTDPLDRARSRSPTARRSRGLIDAVKAVYVSPAVKHYLVQIVNATRNSRDLRLGASPRATLQLLRASRAHAALAGRDYVSPDDVSSLVAVRAGPPGAALHRCPAGSADGERHRHRGGQLGPDSRPPVVTVRAIWRLFTGRGRFFLLGGTIVVLVAMARRPAGRDADRHPARRAPRRRGGSGRPGTAPDDLRARRRTGPGTARLADAGPDHHRPGRAAAGGDPDAGGRRTARAG